MKAVAASLVVLSAILVVGFRSVSEAVTLVVQPPISRSDAPVRLSGSISEPKAGELVTVQAKECGLPGAFRAVTGTQTAADGSWTIDYHPRSTTVFRAVWGPSTSSEATLKLRAGVQLVPRPQHTWRVAVYGIVRLDGKRVTIERFDTASSTWRTIKTVTVRSGSYGEYAEKNGVKLAVPKGTTLRAVLPLAQAKPCYLAGYSPLIRA